MELNKYNKKTKTIFDKSLKKDIDNITNLLLEEYNITDKQHNKIITNEQLYTKIYNLFNPPEKPIEFCLGFKINNNRCSRKPFGEYRYCKSHLLQDTIYQKLQNLYKQNINGILYYIDEKYIYNDKAKKIGYIDNLEYIFTEDPFLLGEIN